jgi:hypothetical protein
LARFMAVIAALGAAAIPLTESLAWAALGYAVRLPAEKLGPAKDGIVAAASMLGLPDDPSRVTTLALVAGWMVALVFATPMMFAWWSVRRTLLESAAGRPFSEASVRSFRRFGWASVAAAAAIIVKRSAVGVVVSTLTPDVPGKFSFGVGTDDISRIFGALLLVAVAHMFAVARRNAEDVEGFL